MQDGLEVRIAVHNFPWLRVLAWHLSESG
jgi:hypothetical protein